MSPSALGAVTDADANFTAASEACWEAGMADVFTLDGNVRAQVVGG
jgi:hypothetical protein